jgi:NTP pyrophosphatase (non-canonical NTP hydrolase)
MAKSLKDYDTIVNDFCNERGWNHTDPNHLSTAIMIELSELAEHYQWKHTFTEFSAEEKKEVGFEFVDILFYFVLFASKASVDIEQAFDEKLEKLRVKYPIGADRDTQHDLYRKLLKAQAN